MFNQMHTITSRYSTAHLYDFCHMTYTAHKTQCCSGMQLHIVNVCISILLRVSCIILSCDIYKGKYMALTRDGHRKTIWETNIILINI